MDEFGFGKIEVRDNGTGVDKTQVRIYCSDINTAIKATYILYMCIVEAYTLIDTKENSRFQF